MLITDFETKHGKDIKSDKRGMAKMWKEAGRVKAILSANTEASSTVSPSLKFCYFTGHALNAFLVNFLDRERCF